MKRKTFAEGSKYTQFGEIHIEPLNETELAFINNECESDIHKNDIACLKCKIFGYRNLRNCIV